MLDLIGIRYKHKGRDKNGYDCYGLCIEVARRMGKTLIDVEYDRNPLSLADEKKPLLNVKKSEIKKGALLEINNNDRLHIGICLDSKTFIHATKTQGVRVSLIKDYNVINSYEIL